MSDQLTRSHLQPTSQTAKTRNVVFAAPADDPGEAPGRHGHADHLLAADVDVCLGSSIAVRHR